MKHVLVILIILPLAAFAKDKYQVAFVELEKIFLAIEEKTTAEKKYDQKKIHFQKEIEKLEKNILDLEKKYEVDFTDLGPKERVARENFINLKKKELYDYLTASQDSLDQKGKEVSRPLLETIILAVKEVAEMNEYVIVLNKSEDFVWANEKVNITQDVIDVIDFEREKKKRN